MLIFPATINLFCGSGIIIFNGKNLAPIEVVFVSFFFAPDFLQVPQETP